MPNERRSRRPLPERLQSTTSIKYSLRSHSSSFEADDERSSSDVERTMGPDTGGHRTAGSQYAGEDTRLTSKRELAGWYAYGFAAEVFVICGMGSFVPITLEQLARENGVLLSDRTTPCVASSTYPNSTVNAASLLSRGNHTPEPDQCVIYFLGMEINTASFAMYSFSLSVLFQFLVVISISCAADHGNYRKRLLLIFAWTGAIATMLFLPVVPSVYLIGALLGIIANTCLGASFVLLNSFLPLLVRHHPEVQDEDLGSDENYTEDEESIAEDEPPPSLTNSTSALLNPTPLAVPATSTALKLSTQISSLGIGISYSAALFVQILSVMILFGLGSSTFSLRLVLFLIGLWWFVFTIPAALWLRPRPGPPLPTNMATSGLTYIKHSWASLYRTIRLTPALPDILLFLASWFLLSDAIATVSGVSILFAKTSLGMPPLALAGISVIVTIAGILGAFTWPHISRFLKLTPLHTILTCIFLFSLIPLYGLLDYIPIFSTLTRPWEMYPLGLLYGFVLGGLSSYCRSLYGELIPPGYEAAFYALYAITDKGSSVFGPAIVGMIVDRTGGIRPAFWFLLCLIIAPGFIIVWIDVDRGRKDGQKIGVLIKAADGLEGTEDDAAEEALHLAYDSEEEFERHPGR
ncbi:hypothetical protein V498_06362 [Pseudogymnoascus sp. VKM F-4517 (FW-2822)]|nr:hypothetical protein V498_06362 [Pseudogymnoascus sp. VKM F-4517 (FW-2822)]